MKLTLTSSLEITEIDPDQYWKFQEMLTFENPKYQEAIKYGRSTWNIDSHIMLCEDIPGGIRTPRGVIIEGMNKAIIDDQRHSHRVSITTDLHLRPYQERVLNLAIGTAGGVIAAPTGSGKTFIGIQLASLLSQRCLILVKSRDLAKQWQGAIKETTGLKCGLIGSGQWTEGPEFTVATIQTLVKHPESLDYGMVLVDECHNTPAEQSFKVINRQSAKYRFGLSATPQRRDGLEFLIHAALGPVIAEVESHELDGAVLPVTVSTLKMDFSGNPESWQDFLNNLENNDQRNELLVTSAIKSSQTVGTAVLTSTISHAEKLHQAILEQGHQATLLHGRLPASEREQRMKVAADSSLIVGTFSLLSEGIDWPHVGSIIFAAPVSASVSNDKPAATRLIQSIGRARRPYPGKTKAFVLDVIDQHPLGLSAFSKRRSVYEQNNFSIR